MVGFDAVEALAERYQMLPEGALVLVAVSGGVDSMCLLNYLHSRGVRVAAAHFNHRLRGADADADESFVREWCGKEHIPCYVASGDVAELAKKSGRTVEEAGRRARYQFLERVADEIGADRIATAHHADDNAETVLFQLVRGARSGLGGIAPVRGIYIRPFLTVTRAQIEAYARENGLPHRTDATNGDTQYSRNYIRHEIMPRLEKVNSAAAAHIAETARALRVEGEFLDGLAAERLERGGARFGDARVTVPCKTVADAPEALRGRMVRTLLDKLPVGKKDFTARHYAAIEGLCVSRYGTWLDLPRGVHAERAGGVLTLSVQNGDTARRTASPKRESKEE